MGATKPAVESKTEVTKPSFGELIAKPSAFIGSFPEDGLVFVAGATAGAFAKTCTAPLDRIKILAQVGNGKVTMTGPVAQAAREKGSIAAFAAIFKYEGIGGYWKGNLAQVIRAIPYDALRLGSYDLAKNTLMANKKRAAKKANGGKEPTEKLALSVPERLAAGAFAGSLSTLLTFPLDTVRTRLAVDPAMKGIWQVLSTMYQKEGFGSFYRGINASILGIAPYIAINYCAYDMLKSEGSPIAGNAPLAALIATLSATAFTYPLDTIRRVQMIDKTGNAGWTGKVAAEIVAERGIGGLYGGIVPNIAKNSPTNTARLVAYDINKKLIKKAKQDYNDMCVVKTV